MKKIWVCLLIVTLLCGCKSEDPHLERAMAMRAELLTKEVSFDARILADYGDKTYEFAMECHTDANGKLNFTVTEPKTIAGIKGVVSSEGGKLTFNDTALAFEKMADGQISPVSGPWVMMKSLRSGYLTSACEEDGLLRIAIDDSYEEDALHLEVWLDEKDAPVQGEIYWQGRRLLTIRIENFQMV